MTTVPAHAEWTLTIKPSKIQQRFVRGQPYFACASTGHLQNFLNQGKKAVTTFQSSNVQCGKVIMTSVTERAPYQAADGTWYKVYVFLNGLDFYTFDK